MRVQVLVAVAEDEVVAEVVDVSDRAVTVVGTVVMVSSDRVMERSVISVVPIAILLEQSVLVHVDSISIPILEPILIIRRSSHISTRR